MYYAIPLSFSEQASLSLSLLSIVRNFRVRDLSFLCSWTCEAWRPSRQDALVRDRVNFVSARGPISSFLLSVVVFPQQRSLPLLKTEALHIAFLD